MLALVLAALRARRVQALTLVLLSTLAGAAAAAAPWYVLASTERIATRHVESAPIQERSLEAVGDVAEPLPDDLPDIDPEQLQQALNEMPEAFRTPIILYYFEDFSYRDIAEQMDLPIGTVMSRLARAKAYLRSRLLQPQAALAANGPPLRRARTDGL